ncbi:MAG: hypothetical protein M1829_004047 [Trizodia sp. TS-e1964]|nr:MAG: hypothetical protein M1829_004047 [Trizodia sp. TS-e1964]
MSASLDPARPAPTVKKFGKGERSIPHHSERAKKWYPAVDEKINKKVTTPTERHRIKEFPAASTNWIEELWVDKVRKSIREAKPRPSLLPGAVLILLAGRFRGKRVILLKHLSQGVLLVTGPYKVNGVPLRRVNARYVIATSAKVDLKGIDEKTVERVAGEGYFTKDRQGRKKGEEEFFKQGEKPEKKKPSSTRAADQKTVDKTLLTNIKKEPFLLSYLGSTFSLRKGDRPHEMNW